ncbi:MAG: hypothetical protein H6735_12695 [Alphaproteobacteria bacterium]|nr:hypothetical protein [Alphaproteobacteria bacterium]
MKVRALQQQDWDQLLLVASGFLPLTDGDLVLAMSRAIAAHAKLIEAVKAGTIEAELPRGTVRLFVPEEGGLALAYTARPSEKTPMGSDRYGDLGPPDITLEVHERPSSHRGQSPEDAMPMEDTSEHTD